MDFGRMKSPMTLPRFNQVNPDRGVLGNWGMDFFFLVEVNFFYIWGILKTCWCTCLRQGQVRRNSRVESSSAFVGLMFSVRRISGVGVESWLPLTAPWPWEVISPLNLFHYLVSVDYGLFLVRVLWRLNEVMSVKLPSTEQVLDPY